MPAPISGVLDADRPRPTAKYLPCSIAMLATSPCNPRIPRKLCRFGPRSKRLFEGFHGSRLAAARSFSLASSAAQFSPDCILASQSSVKQYYAQVSPFPAAADFALFRSRAWREGAINAFIRTRRRTCYGPQSVRPISRPQQHLPRLKTHLRPLRPLRPSIFPTKSSATF